MAGYTIGSEKGKQIANSMKSGDTYKASDGSTWKKNSDGSVSVTTNQGGYTANALGGTSSTGRLAYTTPIETEKPAWLSNDYNPTGGSSSSSANAYYTDALKQLEKQKKAQEEAARKQTQATIDSIYGNVPLINQDYEKQQRENYIANAKAQFGLSDYLKAMGYTGGMTETKATELASSYQDARNTADQNKNNAMQNIYDLAAQAQTTGDTNLASIASNYYSQYAAAAQAQAQQQAEMDKWQQQYATQNQQYADSQAQQAWQNQFAQDQFAYQQSQDAIANNLAKQRLASSGSSSSGSSDEITFSQALQAYNSGIETPAILAKLGLAATGANNQQTANYYSEADRLIQQRSSPSSQAALIKQWNMEGKLTDAQAQELLRRYGLSY